MNETANQDRHEQVEEFKRLMRAADVPLRHAKFKVAENTCAEWATTLATIQPTLGTGRTIAFYGTRGTGKTQLAVELLRAACWDGRTAMYRRVMDFFIEIKSTYGKHAEETEADIIAKYVMPAVLVLDEAHERGGSTWESSLLNLLIDKRYGSMKDTLLIANLDKSGLASALGASAMSRLNETGGFVDCSGWGSFR